MPTYTALTTLPDEASAAALGDAVEALGPSGVGVFEIEDGSGRWEVGGYFLERPDEAALAVLAAAFGAADWAVSEVPDKDWVAEVKRDLTPVRAGRFVVHGGHDRHAVPFSAISLEIEAAMAFGTGHHGTTQGCLTLYDRLCKRGLVARRVADIGCGTGVLAMAAAKRGAARVVATDIDPVAGATARANIAANGVGPRVAVGVGPGLRHAHLRAAAPFDLIFANILARPLKRLAPEMSRATSPGSVIILSGLLDRQRRDVLSVYSGWGFHEIACVSLRGWSSLALRRAQPRPPIARS